MRLAWILVAALLLAVLGWWCLDADFRAHLGQSTDAERADGVEPRLEATGDPAAAKARKRARESLEEHLRSLRRGSGVQGVLPVGEDVSGALVSGRVLGPEGVPLEDAEVGVTDPGSYQDYELADDDGRFTIDVRADHPTCVVFTAPGFIPQVLPWRTFVQGRHVDLGTHALRRGLTISGRVVDRDGASLEAEVRIAPDDDPAPSWWRAAVAARGAFHARTEDAGEGFAFHGLPPGRYRLHVERQDSLDTQIIEAVPAGTGDLRVAFDVEATEEAMEVAEPTEPWSVQLALQGHADVLGGTNVDVHFMGEWDESEYALVDDVIEAEIVGTGPVHARLVFSRVDLMPVVVTNLRPPGGRRVVRLQRGHRLQGQIVGAQSERRSRHTIYLFGWLTQDGVLVPSKAEGVQTYGQWNKTARLDYEGGFEFRGLPSGIARVEVRGERFDLAGGAATVDTTAGHVRIEARAFPVVDVEFRLPPGVDVQEIHWQLEQISKGGAARFDSGALDVEKGDLRLRLELGRAADAHVLRARTVGGLELGPVSVRIPRDAKEVVLEFPPPKLMKGRVVTAAGEPVVRATVQLLPESRTVIHSSNPEGTPKSMEWPEPGTIMTDVEGRFELVVPPSGTWRVVVSAWGLRMRDAPPRVGAGPTTITMEPGLRITGRLRGDPRPVFALRYVVVAWPRDGGIAVRAPVHETGFFELQGLGKGAHTLVAHTRDASDAASLFQGQAVIGPVAAGARGVDVVLRPGLAARLELHDEAGRPLSGAVVHIRGPHRDERVWPVGEGEAFVVRTLWPGRYRFDIEVDAKGHHAVEVEAGKTVRYVVR